MDEIINDLAGDTFVVVVKDEGHYTLATRRVFEWREPAELYAKAIPAFREAIVISGRWNQLRMPNGD